MIPLIIAGSIAVFGIVAGVVCKKTFDEVDDIRQDYNRAASCADQRIDDFRHDAQNAANNFSSKIDDVRRDAFVVLNLVATTVDTLRNDVTDILRIGTNNCVNSMNHLTQSLDSNTHLVANAIQGLVACIALSLLLYLSDFLWMEIRVAIWITFAILCYHLVQTYLQHSRSSRVLSSSSPSMQQYNQVRLSNVV
jgi:hypothetical protein